MSSKTKQAEEKSKDNKKLLIVIIILLAVIIIGGAIILAFVLGKKSSQNPAVADGTSDTGSREVASSIRQIVDEENASSIYEQMRQEVAEGMFECDMSYEWTFKDGKSSSSDAYVANSPNNTHPIYFDVYIKDTDELIYSSPVLPVGTQWTDFKLDKPLEAGSYKCVCMYNLLKDVETQEVISSAGFVVNLNVLN